MSLPVARLLSVLSLWLVAVPPLCTAEVANGPAPTFLAELTTRFSAWDADQDGALSLQEVDRAVADSANRGPAAAVAVALRRQMMMDPAIGSWSLSQIEEDQPAAAGAKPLRRQLEILYAGALKYLTAVPRGMFTAAGPKLDNLGQGHLGDCFLLVGLGVLAEGYPERLQQMLEEKPDGRISVHLGAGRTLDLPAPSDGEIALGACTRATGIWGVAFEKAVGSVYLERQKSPKQVTPLAIVGSGGTPLSPVELITGHIVRRTGCSAFRQAGVSAEERERLLTELRQKLSDAFAHQRLVVGGNGPLNTQAVVPRISYNHSYGVLAYDAATDEVTFWNPHGNNYTPQGEPGLANGYATTHGRFRVPLKEAVQWFGAFSMETDEPLDGTAARVPADQEPGNSGEPAHLEN